jgi:hypothetical protein
METEINLALASATATFASGVSPEQLSKVWRISHEDAKRTNDNTSHLLKRPTNSELSRNYGKMTGYTDTKGSEIISEWIPSFLLRRWEIFQGKHMLPIVCDR